MAKPDTPASRISTPLWWYHARAAQVLGPLGGLMLALASVTAWATTPLADKPIFSTINVPGNLALTLSVEFPTAISVAHTDTNFNGNKVYLGYFDHKKCYGYFWSGNEPDRHFFPQGSATHPGMACPGSRWSGNFLNWATMQTIDPFRWALTGGYRTPEGDTPTLTLIEKAWASGQGGGGNFPNRTLSGATAVDNSTPFNSNPFNWANFRMRVHGRGNQLVFTNTGNPDSNTRTDYTPASAVDPNTVYQVSVRVKVCDNNPASGPMEANCTAYPAGNYKPTGLIHKYADRIKYSAFGYLNDSNIRRDGAVLRARQKFVGPTFQLPAQSIQATPEPEWDANTGVFFPNPDGTDASATAALLGIPIANSGVINYLNKFGQVNTANGYKTFDNVSELYYAALRYFRNLGNVPEWSSMAGASNATRAIWADGFPVITNWDDPIKYSCQRNFVLGIGDVNTHADKNVPGPTASGNEPGKPAAVAADTSVNAVLATNKVGQLHGLGSALGAVNPFNGCCSNNSALMAGLAYDANTRDIRPDDAAKAQTKGMQTVQTYWLDVLEYSNYKPNNQYYLAAKYGGFTVPKLFDPYTRSIDIPLDWWSTTGEMVYGQQRPDNYFVANDPAAMVDGLNRSFSKIADSLGATTTSFSTAVPQVSASGTDSFSARFEPANWTGELAASTTSFNLTTGEPTGTLAWNFSLKLDAQAAGTGWSTARRIVTWNSPTKPSGPSTSGPGSKAPGAGVPFRDGSIDPSHKSALDTVYRLTNDSVDYLNYLRGEKQYEEDPSDTTGTKVYRKREKLLGDIVGSRPRVVKGPTSPFSDSANPGFTAYAAAKKNRRPMVYVGSNNGMLHAVHASTTDAKGGTEVFAYVPAALFRGPTGSPSTTGLVARGDPDFTHTYFVDATPSVFDIDFGKTGGTTGSPDWRTVLVGGLGKGGKSYYALDITNPDTIDIDSAVTNAIETNVANRVLWEFSNPDLGYTFGEPAAVKTKKHGWVLIFVSGYNNSDGCGYFFIVNPKTGDLLEKIKAAGGPDDGCPSKDAGLAHVQAFVPDRTDATADSAYAADLVGNLWRLDLSNATGPAQVVLLARLTDASNQAMPVTTRPMVIVQPTTNTRWVTVGTGRLLDTGDISSSQAQAMFAIRDGTGLQFASTPSPVKASFPITRDELKAHTDLTKKIVLDLNTQIGWYVDLGSSAGMGWRVLRDPTSYFGVVEFAAMLPNDDVCEPSGISRVYAIDLGTGESTLVQADGTTLMAYNDELKGVVQEHRSLSASGKHRFMACNDKGECKVLKTRQPDALNLRRLNWRELPLAN